MTARFEHADWLPGDTLYATERDAHCVAARAIAASVLGYVIDLVRVVEDDEQHVGVAVTGGGVPVEDRQVVAAAGVVAERLVDGVPVEEPEPDVPRETWDRARRIAEEHWLPIQGLAVWLRDYGVASGVQVRQLREIDIDALIDVYRGYSVPSTEDLDLEQRRAMFESLVRHEQQRQARGQTLGQPRRRW